MSLTAGERLFARYAFSPNELGYCGPAGAAALAAAARGDEVAVDLRAIAAQFSGAWVYQVIIARMLGADPLDPAVVRGYWTGTAATESLDRDEFWSRLLAVIGPRAGAYWRHLDDALAVEASASHAFHVLGVYPWTRLLDTGMPEPLHVLNSCCIRPGLVVDRVGDALLVEADALVVSGGGLRWVAAEPETVTAPFDVDIAPGETVALHWGAACDRLTPDEAGLLRSRLQRQADLVGRRGVPG